MTHRNLSPSCQPKSRHHPDAVHKLQELTESCATGINDEIREDAIDKHERLVGCRSPEHGLANVREDSGGRLVALLRGEVFCADPLELLLFFGI